MSVINIINGGLMTTVQDRGRLGYQASGMQVSGVMDKYSAAIANALVCNDSNAAVLETTFMGPELEVQEKLLLAVAGGKPILTIDGKEAASYTSHLLVPGQRLKVSGMKAGLRAYIAVSGGFDVPVVMGSRSTNLKLGIGGFQGRKLNNGDILPVGNPSKKATDIILGNAPARYAECFIPKNDINTIRIVLGPQKEYFSDDTLRALEESEYLISNEADRMGYRLEGNSLEKTITKDLITDGIVFGSIQIPPNGQPIIMMADHQTTGGYPKLGTVCSVDLPVLAQCIPGTKIKFKTVSVHEAQQLLREKEKWLQDFVDRLDKKNVSQGKEKQFKLKINGELFDVSIEEIS